MPSSRSRRASRTSYRSDKSGGRCLNDLVCKGKVETLNITNRQRGLLKANVIKCEERLSRTVPAASAVAGEREAEKWVVVRRRTARWRR